MIDTSFLQNKNGKYLLLAYDQGMEVGAEVFDTWSADIQNIFKIAETRVFGGIAVQKGIAEIYSEKYRLNSVLSYKASDLIIKVNGKSSLGHNSGKPYQSSINCRLDYAVSLGAKAIGYTIYPGSNKENEIFAELGEVQESCRSLKIPLIVWSYTNALPKEDQLDPRNIGYAARIAMELGADLIKVKYPEFSSDFSYADKVNVINEICALAVPKPVLFAGGAKENEGAFFEKVSIIKASNAGGMVVGRNVWTHKEPFAMAQKLGHVFES